MAGRPPINLHAKVRDVLGHTLPFASGPDSPISNFEGRVNASLNLIKYVDDHISTQSVYNAVYDRHMALLHGMVLGRLIESFERFIKELAVVCVDTIADYTFDDRFDKLSTYPGSIAIQFNAGSVGRALCESDTWLNNNSVNERFRHMLKPHFGGPWEYLFPNASQQPQAERDRATTLSILWQVRHNITHNTGLLTDADARRLTLMVKSEVESGKTLNPSTRDLRYVKRFLVEAAGRTNERVADRVAELLSELHDNDNSLFDPQSKADSTTASFHRALTIAGATGVL